MTMHRLGPVLAVAAAAALTACGGGGGGGGAAPGATPTPVPTSTPAPGNGFVPPAGAVTLMTGSVTGTFGSAIVQSSADGVMTAEAASAPTQPPSGGSLPQYTATVQETAGVATLSAGRAAQSTHALETAIAQDRLIQAGDRLRERPPDPALQRAHLRTLSATRAQTPASRRTQAAQGTPGQQRQFKILTGNIGNSGGCAGGTTNGVYICFTTITATLEAVGVHGNVWVDNASLSTGDYTNVPGEFQTIASKFDGYYTTETSAFAAAFYPGTSPITFHADPAHGRDQCDANGNPLPQGQWQTTDVSGNTGTSIDIVITDALAGTGEGGYYASFNEVPQAVWDCGAAPRLVSNNTAMLVIAGNNYTGLGPGIPAHNEPFWLNTDVPRSLSHELQHLLHAHYKFLRPFALGNSAASAFDDAFIDEGMSMLAEDLAADGVHIDTPRYSFAFLLEPSLFSLTAFTGFQPNPTSTGTNPPYGWYSNTPGSYGQAYLFQRYLYDRFGSAEINAIYNSTAPGIGPVLAAVPGESFPQLYREFSTAVSAQTTSVTVSPYTFSSAIVLRGNVDVPSVRTGAQSTRHLVFGGPQPPRIFNGNQPSGFLTLGPGTNATTFAIDGGTLYLPSANGGSGTTIMVSIPAAPALEGSLIQGTLPTPPPSST